MENLVYSLVLFTIYLSLIIVGIISVFLYNRAYYEMKKTRMIYSVYLLLVSLLIENLYFGFAALLNNFKIGIYHIFLHPFFWALPKLLILITLIYFIYVSLSPNEYEPLHKIVKNKDK